MRRRVQTMKWAPADGPYIRPRNKLVDDRHGWLHAFCTESEELNSGILHCACGVVEFEDGTIEALSVNLIRFIDEPSEA